MVALQCKTWTYECARYVFALATQRLLAYATFSAPYRFRPTLLSTDSVLLLSLHSRRGHAVFETGFRYSPGGQGFVALAGWRCFDSACVPFTAVEFLLSSNRQKRAENRIASALTYNG